MYIFLMLLNIGIGPRHHARCCMIYGIHFIVDGIRTKLLIFTDCGKTQTTKLRWFVLFFSRNLISLIDQRNRNDLILKFTLDYFALELWAGCPHFKTLIGYIF